MSSHLNVQIIMQRVTQVPAAEERAGLGGVRKIPEQNLSAEIFRLNLTQDGIGEGAQATLVRKVIEMLAAKIGDYKLADLASRLPMVELTPPTEKT